MEKTYSQKIAGKFRLSGYILLAPTVLSLIYPVMFVIGGLMEKSATMVGLGLIPITIAGTGTILLFGYVKHSKGKLNEKYVPALWISTAVYNFLLLLPWLYVAANGIQSLRNMSDDEYLVRAGLIALVIFGYKAAIYFSIKAYSFEKRVKLL